MTRTTKTIPVGGDVRHVVTLRDQVQTDPAAMAHRRYAFLLELATDGPYSGLLNCGPAAFETLKMYHDGTAWVAVLEATEPL